MLVGAAPVDEVSTHVLGRSAAAPTRSGGQQSMERLQRLPQQDEAPTMTEYATALSAITILCLGAFALVAAANTGALAHVAGYFT
jgi:hypothetical protein